MKKLFALLIAMMLVCSCALAEAGLTNFQTYDLSTVTFDEAGEMTIDTVTHEIFADYDLTMVNVWATWCGYCVQEIPELARLKDMLPENVNLISICTDAHEETALAYSILQGTGATNFPTLFATMDMADFLNGIYSFPTTVFLDSNGMPVGKPISGVPSLDDTAEVYLAIIEEVLASMES